MRRVRGEVGAPTLTDARLRRQVIHVRHAIEHGGKIDRLQRGFDQTEIAAAAERLDVLFFDPARIIVGKRVQSDHLDAVVRQRGRQI